MAGFGIFVSMIFLPLHSSNFSINDLDEIVFRAGGTEILFWDGVELQTVYSSLSVGGFVGTPRLNNNREIVFVQSLENGLSEVFLARPITIPEPSTFVLLSIGSVALIGYGRRHKRKQAA